MNVSSNPGPKPSHKSRVFLIVGFVFLFVMGLSWSLDNSIVYSSFGAAVFFLFLAYYHRPGQAAQPYQKNYQRYSSRQSHARKDVITELLDSLKGKKTSSYKANPQSQHAHNSKKFAMMVMLFVSSAFVIITLAVVFADDPIEEVAPNEYYEIAEQQRYSGNYDSAAYYYRQALVDDPQNLNALNGLGILSINQERYEMALNQFDDALSIDPDYQYARYNKALTLYYQHNYRKSLSETLNLLKRSPEYYDAMQLAGDNYYDQQRYDSAKFWYDQGYDSGLRNAWICHVLGYLYDRTNETQRAADLYKEALSYDSTKVDVYARLGEMYPGEDGNFYRMKAAQLKQASK